MGANRIQDILPLVEKPSHYLGSEVNRVKKLPETVQLRFALAFPDLYEIGTSHFGIQILYHILNRQPDISAERVYAPGMDAAGLLKKMGAPLLSLESRTPIRQFDVVGFSLLYEMNYTNVLMMLELSEIPFFSRDRDESFPVVIAGGPCTVNPEPVAEFFDAIVVGDGESVILDLSRAWKRWRADGSGNKERLLESWSRIAGVYIPAFYRPVTDRAGFQRLEPLRELDHTVRRAVVADLDSAPFPDSPVVPFGRPVHDRLRLEISRGCTRGCRFCQAGMTYRPVRERSTETLFRLCETSLAKTGYEDLSLLSLSTGDYTGIVPLMARLMARCGTERVAVSLPSLRAGTLTPEMMRMIKSVRKTGFTIAPEAGSQRLRNVINKNITAEDIILTVRDAFALGWKVVKLYFMVGLPTETDRDLSAIEELVKDIIDAAGIKKRRGQVNISIATFIPKSHTPFQWDSQDELETAKDKIFWVRDRLRKPGIHFKWQNPHVSRVEGVWARGDRRLNRLLVKAYEKGCMFDGWSDRFDYQRWTAAIEESGVDVDFFTTRQRSFGEPLPWDHIDSGVTRQFLESERKKADLQESTADCRSGDVCNSCGACDFDTVAPRTFSCRDNGENPSETPVHESEGEYLPYEVVYSKKGPARFFGHLELMSIFIRALRRAGIRVRFSRGFHPKPKLSFDDPLPVGMESEGEILRMAASAEIHPEGIVQLLNPQLPEGLSIVSCRRKHREKHPTERKITYKIEVKDGVFEEKQVKCFFEKDDWPVRRKDRKGREKRIDLKRLIVGMERRNERSLTIAVLSRPGTTVRPGEVLRHVFGMTEDQCKTARIVKEFV